MNKFFGIVIILAVTLLMGQTAPQSWSGVETVQLLASCVTHHSDSVLCAANDGVAFSFQGGAFVKLTLPPIPGPKGDPGPQGSPGVGLQGITGAQGPPGIVNGSSFTLTCAPEKLHSIGTGFSTQCNLSNLIP